MHSVDAGDNRVYSSSDQGPQGLYRNKLSAASRPLLWTAPRRDDGEDHAEVHAGRSCGQRRNAATSAELTHEGRQAHCLCPRVDRSNGPNNHLPICI